MNKYFIIFLLSVTIQSCIVPVDINNKSKYALKEIFVENNVGWLEETNEFHELEIKNGYYFINSKDTSFVYTSTSPLDKSFLFGLKNFELETTFQLVKKSPKITQFGVFFISGILRYDFILDFDGKGIVKESNNKTEIELILIKKQIVDFKSKGLKSMKIILDDRNFSFFIDDYMIGQGIVRSGSWQEMRVFISSGTDLMMRTFNILRK